MVDIDDLVRPALEESDRAGGRVDVKLDPRPRAEWMRSLESFDRAVPIDTTDARQGVPHDRLFGRELGVVGKMLKVAAAASPVPQAGRLDSAITRLEYGNDFPASRPTAQRLDLDFQPIAGCRRFDQNHSGWSASQTETARNNPLNGDFVPLSDAISCSAGLHFGFTYSRFLTIRMRSHQF